MEAGEVCIKIRDQLPVFNTSVRHHGDIDLLRSNTRLPILKTFKLFHVSLQGQPEIFWVMQRRRDGRGDRWQMGNNYDPGRFFSPWVVHKTLIKENRVKGGSAGRSG